MNDINYEIANPDPTGTITSLNSLDARSEFDADWTIAIREQAVAPPISVSGHLCEIGVVTCLPDRTFQHRGTHGADFLLAWTGPPGYRQLTCGGGLGAPARATGAQGRADDSTLGAEI
ncbi:hypothetical protein [Amycolatopsis japonica]|uniref:hypothetical protein n=1 Tax=Amycolatopsis japonica TaxID=208439 RepID=UPI0033F2D7E0